MFETNPVMYVIDHWRSVLVLLESSKVTLKRDYASVIWLLCKLVSYSLHNWRKNTVKLLIDALDCSVSPSLVWLSTRKFV